MAQQGSGIVTTVTLVTAVVWVGFLAQELRHAMGTARKKENWVLRGEILAQEHQAEVIEAEFKPKSVCLLNLGSFHHWEEAAGGSSSEPRVLPHHPPHTVKTRSTL